MLHIQEQKSMGWQFDITGIQRTYKYEAAAPVIRSTLFLAMEIEIDR